MLYYNLGCPNFPQLMLSLCAPLKRLPLQPLVVYISLEQLLDLLGCNIHLERLNFFEPNRIFP
jgi:hypothetical protein